MTSYRIKGTDTLNIEYMETVRVIARTISV